MGSYTLVRKLATGGMAEVFLAKAVGAGGFEKPVAVKRVLPHMTEDQRFVELFMREARLTVNLQHHNVVQVLDLGTRGREPYMVLELVDGENLRTLLKVARREKQQIQLKEALFIVWQVAEGLAYAHERLGADGAPLKLVHRDINPANVLISSSGEVKLADFGIARAADVEPDTQAGVVKGKPGYLAPEQVAGEAPGQHTDVFLLGLMLHELLVGKPLFHGQPFFQALKLIRAFHPNQLERPDHVPEAVWKVLCEALAPDPRERLAPARAFAERIESYLFEQRLRVGARDVAALFARLMPHRLSLLQDMQAPAGDAVDLDPWATPAELEAPGEMEHAELSEVGQDAAPGVPGDPRQEAALPIAGGNERVLLLPEFAQGTQAASSQPSSTQRESRSHPAPPSLPGGVQRASQGHPALPSPLTGSPQRASQGHPALPSPLTGSPQRASQVHPLPTSSAPGGPSSLPASPQRASQGHPLPASSPPGSPQRSSPPASTQRASQGHPALPSEPPPSGGRASQGHLGLPLERAPIQAPLRAPSVAPSFVAPLIAPVAAPAGAVRPVQAFPSVAVDAGAGGIVAWPRVRNATPPPLPGAALPRSVPPGPAASSASAQVRTAHPAAHDPRGPSPVQPAVAAAAASGRSTGLTGRGTPRLGELLLMRGVVSLDGLETALRRQRREGGPLGELLLEQGLIAEESLLKALSTQQGLPHLTSEALAHHPAPAADVLHLFPRARAEKLGAVPLSLQRRELTCALAGHADLKRLDELAFVTGLRIRPVLCTQKALRSALTRFYDPAPLALSEPDELDLIDEGDRQASRIHRREQESSSSLEAPAHPAPVEVPSRGPEGDEPLFDALDIMLLDEPLGSAPQLDPEPPTVLGALATPAWEARAGGAWQMLLSATLEAARGPASRGPHVARLASRVASALGLTPPEVGQVQLAALALAVSAGLGRVHDLGQPSMPQLRLLLGTHWTEAAGALEGCGLEGSQVAPGGPGLALAAALQLALAAGEAPPTKERLAQAFDAVRRGGRLPALGIHALEGALSLR